MDAKMRDRETSGNWHKPGCPRYSGVGECDCFGDVATREASGPGPRCPKCGNGIHFAATPIKVICDSSLHEFELNKFADSSQFLPAPRFDVERAARKIAIELCAEFINSDPLLYCPATVTKTTEKIRTAILRSVGEGGKG